MTGTATGDRRPRHATSDTVQVVPRRQSRSNTTIQHHHNPAPHTHICRIVVARIEDISRITRVGADERGAARGGEDVCCACPASALGECQRISRWGRYAGKGTMALGVARRSSLTLAEQTPRPASANANRDVSSPLLDPLSQDLWSRYTRSRDIDLLSFIQYRSMPKLASPLPRPVHAQPSSRALSRSSL